MQPNQQRVIAVALLIVAIALLMSATGFIVYTFGVRQPTIRTVVTFVTPTPTPTTVSLPTGEWADLSTFNDQAFILDLTSINNDVPIGTLTTVSQNCYWVMSNTGYLVRQYTIQASIDQAGTITLTGTDDEGNVIHLIGTYDQTIHTFTFATTDYQASNVTGPVMLTLQPQIDNPLTQAENMYSAACGY